MSTSTDDNPAPALSPTALALAARQELGPGGHRTWHRRHLWLESECWLWSGDRQ